MGTPRTGAGDFRPPLDAEPSAPREPSAGSPRVSIVCVGNTLMADDGVGAAVARQLRHLGLPAGCVLDVRAYADMSLVGILRQSDAVIVVDGLDAGAEPGAIFRFTPDEGGLTGMRTHNSHGMGLGYAVSSARMIGVDPPVVVFAVQVGDIRPLPDSLSPPVEAVVPDVAAMVLAEAGALLEAASGQRSQDVG